MNKEILWNIINSLLAGALVFFGGFTTGSINLQTVILSFFASALVAITQFKSFWDSEKIEYSSISATPKLFNFLGM